MTRQELEQKRISDRKQIAFVEDAISHGKDLIAEGTIDFTEHKQCVKRFYNTFK